MVAVDRFAQFPRSTIVLAARCPRTRNSWHFVLAAASVPAERVSEKPRLHCVSVGGFFQNPLSRDASHSQSQCPRFPIRAFSVLSELRRPLTTNWRAAKVVTDDAVSHGIVDWLLFESRLSGFRRNHAYTASV